MNSIDKKTLKFLRDLKKNNDRGWFEKNKATYLEEKEKMEATCQLILDDLKETDLIDTVTGKKAVYRIYRDVRFSKDKSPYKSHLAAYFRRSTAELRGGYYIRIQPGNSVVAGGFWGPNKEDLKHIRQQIAMDDEPLRKVIRSKKFKTHFGQLEGEQLKTAPKGWPKDHPSIDLLRYKQYLVTRHFSDKEVLSGDFVKEVNKTYLALRPFFDVMSMYLTTDLNGEPLIRE